MGRRENAVAAGTRQSEALALWLRSQRERRGVTYAAMAKLTDYQFTASVLSRGASGQKVPSRRLVVAYTEACGADIGEAVRLWKAARWAEEEHRRRAGASPEFRDLAMSLRSALTHPELIDTFGQLRDAMVQLRAREGQPSLGFLQSKAGRTSDGRQRLPKSSLSVILRGEALPSRAHLTAFMEALGASPRRVRCWEQTWDRIAQSPTRKSAVAVEIRILEAPPAGLPDERHVPTPVSDADFDFLQAQVQAQVQAHPASPAAPGAWQGPQLANLPAGYTRSGLPIRAPRRYEGLSYRQPHRPLFSTRTWTVPLPQDVPSSNPPTTQEQTPARQVPRSGKVTATAAPPRRIARVVDRLFPRKSRRRRDRWPQY